MSGTHAAAAVIPRNATAISGPLGSTTATRSPPPTPNPRRAFATPFHLAEEPPVRERRAARREQRDGGRVAARGLGEQRKQRGRGRSLTRGRSYVSFSRHVGIVQRDEFYGSRGERRARQSATADCMEPASPFQRTVGFAPRNLPSAARTSDTLTISRDSTCSDFGCVEFHVRARYRG